MTNSAPAYIIFSMNNPAKTALPLDAKEYYKKQAEGNLGYYHINTTFLKEIFPIDVGYEKHTVTNSFSNKYPYYLLHFVKCGKGRIEFDGVITEFPRNSLFVLPPDKTITYHTVPGWEYYWINFNGTAAKSILNKLGISEQRYSMRFPNNALLHFFREAFAEINNKSAQIFTVTHCLFAIFAQIAKQASHDILVHENKRSYFGEIYDYIHEHLYDVDLNARKTAEHFFISPCYFSTLFKKHANSSFKEYVNYERIKKATELLETTNLIVKQVAEAVGFADPLYFCKVFKRYRLVSPQEYRISIKQKQ